MNSLERTPVAPVGRREHERAAVVTAATESPERRQERANKGTSMDNSKGRYWDKPWSLIDGCTPCSPGCEHCWSAAMTQRFGGKGRLVDEDGNPFMIEDGKFTGEIKLHPERLDIPLRTRKPTVFAVWNDLFHEDVPDKFRDDAYAVMHGCDRHTYLILTKRADNLRRFMRDNFLPGYRGRDHIWHGVTVCNQQEADAKIPELLKVSGKRWLSIEPMLGPIDFFRCSDAYHDALSSDLKSYRIIDRQYVPDHACPTCRDSRLGYLQGIDAVVLGGETGPGARPMHPDWVRGVRDQCQAARVAFYFKQWGEWGPKAGEDKYAPQCFAFGDGLGDVPVFRVGSKRAGRTLDGREWNGLAWNDSKGISFRCIFCGQEHTTVEACNVCETSH